MVDSMTKSMLGLTTGLQSAGLMGENLNYALGKKKKKKKLLDLSVTNIAGMGLIGAQANIIAGL